MEDLALVYQKTEANYLCFKHKRIGGPSGTRTQDTRLKRPLL